VEPLWSSSPVSRSEPCHLTCSAFAPVLPSLLHARLDDVPVSALDSAAANQQAARAKVRIGHPFSIVLVVAKEDLKGGLLGVHCELDAFLELSEESVDLPSSE